jgi:ubiquinone/menaquinone biosynthesis C-methylase UbiE
MEPENNNAAAGAGGGDSYIEKLTLTDPLREPVIRSAINTLQPPAGSRGLDAGCGIGLQALSLLEAVQPGGHVTCLDQSSEFLAHAKQILATAGRAGQVSFRQGDINKLPFGDNSFDWVWSADCAGYPAREPLSFAAEFVRVARPGGVVAILIYSSQNLLPGYPLLEARLNATVSGIAPFEKDMKPGLHSLRALGWLREAGLKKVRAKTFAGGFHAPLSDDIREALISLLQMRWINVEPELTREDRAEYRRLCRPESPDFIINLPDYYAFFTYSLFWGEVSI